MTNLFEDGNSCFQDKYEVSPANKFVISTGAQRSGEICGSFSVLTQTLKSLRCASFTVRAASAMLGPSRVRWYPTDLRRALPGRASAHRGLACEPFDRCGGDHKAALRRAAARGSVLRAGCAAVSPPQPCSHIRSR